MRISIETTLLADAALSGAPHSGLSLNGQQIVDSPTFFRAASQSFFARGGLGVVLQFAVTRTFSTLKAAEAFLLLHCGAIPLSGLVTCECGDGGDLQTVYLPDAVVEAVQFPNYRGLSVTVQYTIRGGRFESDVPPEDIPGDPDNGEEFIVLRRGKVAITTDAESVAVVFSTPLSAVPVVTCNVSRPSGGDVIRATLREDSISASGFTVDLSAPAPVGSKLHYVAVE